jgi:hypothetical protein
VIRRAFRRGLALGLLGGAAAAALRAVQGRKAAEPAPAPATEWPPLAAVPEPAVDVVVSPGPDLQPARAPHVEVPEPPVPEWQPPVDEVAEAATTTTPKKKAPPKAKAEPWVEPTDGGCPASHPVKAKLSSKIFHLPGMLNYERTAPDRCYIDASAAEADGLRAAKR